MEKMIATAFAVASLALVTVAALPALAADSPPQPKGGAVKGAVVGGVAGHVLGGHAKAGAAIGAVAGHHERAKSQASINAGGKP